MRDFAFYAFAQQCFTYLQFIALCYVVLVTLFYLLSDFVMFLPPRPPMYQKAADIVMLETTQGSQIAARYYANQNAKYTILYSHGNAEDLGTSHLFLQYLSQQGYAVLAYDYEGYGYSTGKPSEQGCYRAIFAAYDYLSNKLNIPAERIIVFGNSIGSGPTVELASQKAVGGIILQAPFVSAYRVKTHIPLIPFDKFVNIRKIPDVKAPLLIIHGDRDSIIPYWHGKKLFAQANEPKTFVQIEHADHNDLIQVAKHRYWDAIQQFTQQLDKQESV